MEGEIEQIAEGQTAPDFEFVDNTGRTTKLSSLRGKKSAVIYFYPRDFTPGCTTEASEFSRDYDKFADAKIEIIGISPDDEESHKKFRQKMKVPYPLVSDTRNIISKRYGSYGPKNFMGKNYLGVSRSTFLVSKDGKIIKIFRKVKPAGHSQEVLEVFSAYH